MIRRVVGIYFSPVGGTARMTEMLTRDIASRLEESSPEEVRIESYDLLEARQNGLTLDNESIAVIGMPVYVGKVPLPAIKALERIRAAGTQTVIAVSYGGRTYGNALYELQHYAEEHDFSVIGAGAFAVSYVRNGFISGARSSAQSTVDKKSLGDFARAAAAKISRLYGCEIDGLKIEPMPVEVAGKMPTHGISRISPRAAAVAQEILERLTSRRRESEWYL